MSKQLYMCTHVCKERQVKFGFCRVQSKAQLKARKRNAGVPPDQKHHVICNFLYQEIAAAQF